jgi:hypothetical protein
MSGRLRQVAQIQARSAEQSLEVPIPTPQGRGLWQTGPLFDDFTYRVAAGDCLTDWYQLQVVAAPALNSKSARVRAPEYAGRRETVVENLQGSLSVIDGSEIVIRAAPTERGGHPKLQCRVMMQNKRERIDFTAKDDGVPATPAFTPVETSEYALTVVDGYGLTNRVPETLAVKIVPDRLPRVTVPRPGRDLLVLPDERIPIRASAVDDLGVRELKFMMRSIRAESASAEEVDWDARQLAKGGPERLEVEGGLEITPSHLGLAAGDRLEYKAEATDYADDAVLRRSPSPVYRITVMSHTEHLERVLKKLKEIQVELLRLAALQSSEAERSDKMAKKASTADIGAQAARARQREMALARSTENAARRMEGVIPELARNDSASTRMLTDLERLSRGVESVARQPMSEAIQSLGRASQPGTPGEQNPQAGHAQQARNAQNQASEQLRQLARLMERLQRRGLLEKLAEEAERLAGEQDDLGKATLRSAVAGGGLDKEKLDREGIWSVDRIVSAQKAIHSGVTTLGTDIEKASRTLAAENPRDAAKAEEASARFEQDGLQPLTRAIAGQLERNVLFSQLPRQKKVADSLREIAEILRRSDDMLESIAKELEEFIKRQKELNGSMSKAIAKEPDAEKPLPMGERQAQLERDVSEQASALQWLARELQMFKSETAEKLDLAAGEMRSGSQALFASALPSGLVHGKRALAYLESAREKFEDESQQMEQQAQQSPPMEALLLLYRILIGQKQVNRDTQTADRTRATAQDTFASRVVALARKQTGLRVDMGRLIRLLQAFPDAAQFLDLTSGKMDLSRIALQAADTGRDTRVVQRQIVAMLEQLLQNQQQQQAGAAGRAAAMMQMMAGAAGGGFFGGTNAPLAPATLDEAKQEAWSKMRARFKEKLGHGFESEFPIDYRGLLGSYFESLRKEVAAP